VIPLPLILAAASAVAVLIISVFIMMIRITIIRGQRNAEPRCPNCKIHDIRPSFQKGFQDTLFRVFSCMPYRCRACEKRFYRYVERKEEDVSTAA
jgi:hypothetical protein